MNDLVTLLWKEYRNNTHLMIFAFSVLALPIIWANSMTILNARPDATTTDCLSAGMIIGGIVAIVLSQFVFLCLGGHLIGGERGGRTFEFLFLQPVSRLNIALSKLLFALVWAVATWLFVGGIAGVGYLMHAADNQASFEPMNSSFFVEVGVVGLMLFSTAWLASSRLNNSVIAMCVGAFGSSVVFLFLMMVIGDRFEDAFTFNEYNWTRIIVMIPVSIAALVAGIVFFTKRKSP